MKLVQDIFKKIGSSIEPCVSGDGLNAIPIGQTTPAAGKFTSIDAPVGRCATLTVAANDSSTLSKQQADYVCDGTDDNVQIQAAIDALTSGRTRQEKVVILGNFIISAGLKLPSYTHLEIVGSITLANGVNDAIIENLNASDNDITISGGKLYGNSAGQTDGAGIELLSVTRFNVRNIIIYDTKIDGIKMRSCTRGIVANIQLEDTGNHAIFAGYNSSYINISNIVSIHPGTEHICIEWYGSGADLHANYNHHITVSDIIGYDAQNSGFYVQHAYKIAMSNLISQGSERTGLRIYDANDVSVANVSIYDVVLSFGVWIGGSLAHSTYNISLTNIIVDGVVSASYGQGFSIGGDTHDVMLSGCMSSNTTLYSYSLSGALRVTMVNCIGRDTADYGFASGTTSKDIIVDGCIFDNTNGMYIGIGTYRIAVNNCTIKDVTSPWHYVRINTVTDAIFSGNRIFSELGTNPDYVFWIDNLPASSIIDIKNNITNNAPVDVALLYTIGNNTTSRINMYEQHIDLLQDCLAISTTHVRSNEDLSAATPITFTLDAQPDVPRTLSWSFDSHAQITEYDMEVIGIDANGNSVTETWDETAGWSGETSNAFAMITSIKMTSRTGTGAADTMDIGITDVLGLSNIIYETSDVFKIKKNNANATVASAQVNTTYGTYDMSVITLGAGDDFTIWYKSNLNIIS